jgi:hypothetical protein
MLTLGPLAKTSGYWTIRRGRRFGYVAWIGLPITNTSQRFTFDFFFTFHLSPITSHISQPR